MLVGVPLQSQSLGTLPAIELHDFEARVWNEAVPQRAVIALVPRVRRPDQRFPLLIALHGLGETNRGCPRGAWGWVQDYALARADNRLRHPPLVRTDFEDLITPDRLRALNTGLSTRSYEGLVVLLPFTIDVRRELGGSAHQSFDRWLSTELVERARRELPVLAGREHVGIDGISLGGLHALWTGLGHPEVFGSVGAMQAAVRTRVEPVLRRYARAPRRPLQSIRISTSTEDTLRVDVEALHAALNARHIRHEFKIHVGPHDYPFNRGPGAIEMLLYHDRILRGHAAQ